VCCHGCQELAAYKELLELLPTKGVSVSAVLPETGPAVALPAVCRLNRVDGVGGAAQARPLLFVGECRGHDLLKTMSNGQPVCPKGEQEDRATWMEGSGIRSPGCL
jgi:hypothetical protein